MGREENKAFCILPWIDLAVFPEGSARLCCVADHRVNEEGTALSLSPTPWRRSGTRGTCGTSGGTWSVADS